MIQNPILKGFSPDPSIIRVGKDYYIAASTFEWWPGVKLFHSTDLANWEQIASPLRRESQLNMIGDPTSGGVWAPCLSYDGTYYYLIYTDVKTKKGRYYNTHNYMVYTSDIYGDWSEPVYLNSIGFDPSLFHDTDGKKYLINMVNGFKGVLVQEIQIEESNPNFNPQSRGKGRGYVRPPFQQSGVVSPAYRQPVCHWVGEQKNVYAGSGLGYTEGPHMYHIGDWYYLIVAEGGTSYDHCVTMARSKSIWGPFETAPENPILTSDQTNLQELQKCGHADIVETPDGEWYLVHLCSRPLNGKKWCTLGRETAIQKMHWNADGWLELEGGGRFAKMQVPEPGDAQKANQNSELSVHLSGSDNLKNLPPCISSPRADYHRFLVPKGRSGWIRLRGQESMNSLHHVSLLATRQRSICASAETRMDFQADYPEQLAGLAYLYDALNFYIFGKTATEDGESILTIIKSDGGVITDEMEPVKLPEDVPVCMKCQISEDGSQVQFFYRFESDSEWLPAGGTFSTELVTDEHCLGFTGAHFGLYIHDMTGQQYCADFEYFDVSAEASSWKG